MEFMISFCVVAMLAIGILVAIRSEAKRFNKGKCPDCGCMLRYFDTDSQEGRGYVCDVCGYNTWVSFPNVDEQFGK